MTNNDRQLYINGQWVAGRGLERQLINPATEHVLAELKEATKEQTDQAVQAAKRAFSATDWSTDKERRIRVLRQLADGLEQQEERFARIESENVGKPIRESRLDVADSVSCLRYYADFVEQLASWEKQMADGTTSVVTQEPIGVCALIVPWNFPLLLGIWKIAPALAAGNTIVFKPSELTCLSMIEFAQLVDEADVPAGVFNLVPGGGDPVGTALVTHPDVGKVSFTGGSATGKHINEQCARSFKRVSLELGGKSPLIILKDIDLEAAVEWAIFGGFLNQGEVCVASSRLLVHEHIEGAFLHSVVEKLKALRIGNPLQGETQFGPLVSKGHLEKVAAYVSIGQQEGAQLLYGGKRLPGRGYYLSPAVFTNVRQSMRTVQEEIFGPVVTVQSFRSEEEAISLANGTVYGLAAGVLGKDKERAEHIAKRLTAGTVWVNGYHTPYVEAPWGGFKRSGIGRELGPQGYASFTETKHVNVSTRLKRPGWYRF